VKKWKLLAYHLEDLRIPQVGNPCSKESQSCQLHSFCKKRQRKESEAFEIINNFSVTVGRAQLKKLKLASIHRQSRRKLLLSQTRRNFRSALFASGPRWNDPRRPWYCEGQLEPARNVKILGVWCWMLFWPRQNRI